MSKMGSEAAVTRCAIDGDTIKSRFDIPTPGPSIAVDMVQEWQELGR